jgi:hypothetical protein
MLLLVQLSSATWPGPLAPTAPDALPDRTEPVCSGAAAGAAVKCLLLGSLTFGLYSA